MFRKFLCAILVIVCALFVVACGNNDKITNEQEDIVDNKVLIEVTVGLNLYLDKSGDSYSVIFTNQETNDIKGITVSLSEQYVGKIHLECGKYNVMVTETDDLLAENPLSQTVFVVDESNDMIAIKIGNETLDEG